MLKKHCQFVWFRISLHSIIVTPLEVTAIDVLIQHDLMWQTPELNDSKAMHVIHVYLLTSYLTTMQLSQK